MTRNHDRNRAWAGRPLVKTAGGASTGASVDCGVPPPEPTRKLASLSWTRSLILLAVVASLAALLGARSATFLQGSDFPHFYCAARMLADGRGNQLYDVAVQQQYQARYAGRIGTLYTHPPFEALLYLAVAWLPLRRAYLLWSLLSMGFFAGAARQLAKETQSPWDWRVLFAVSLCFAPALVCLLQGQDSMLLLSLVMLAFTALRCGRAFAAGCWLGLGLFKFQLLLPLVLVLVFTQGRRATTGLAKGFGLLLLVLAGLSVGISGWSVLALYPNFLLHYKEHQVIADILPQAMANFRGLVFLCFGSDHSPFAIIAVAMLSGTALLITVRAWRDAPISNLAQADRGLDSLGKPAFDLAFATTVLFALLVSYHLYPHDLSLLWLPLVLLLRASVGTAPSTSFLRRLALGLVAVLFLPPLHLLTLQFRNYALVSIALTGLFAVSAFWAVRARAAGSK